MKVSQLLPRVSSDRIERSARLLGLLLLAPILAALSSPALAQDEPAVEVSAPDTSAAPGDTVAVPIRVSNLDSAAAVTNYELELDVENGSVASYPGTDSFNGFETENTLSSVIGFILQNPDIPGIYASGQNVINEEADDGEGVLIRVLFEIESEGSTTVSLTRIAFNPGNPPPTEPAEPQFTLTGATNTSPEVVGSLADDTLAASGPGLQLTGLEQTFNDPDGDALSFSGSSSNPNVATAAQPSGTGSGVLLVTPEGVGEAQISVTATDPSGASATEAFDLVVEELPDGEEVAEEVASSFVDTSGSGPAEASFGDTGAQATFENVQQGGTVKVSFFSGGDSGSGTTSDGTMSNAAKSGAAKSDLEDFENVSPYRWDIENSGAAFGSVDVTFSLDDPDVEGIEEPSSVTILVAEDPSGTFEPVTTEYDSGENALIARGLTGFSTFRMASNSSSNPLPVEMAAFTATATESGALLEWRTASETGNAGFEVQHQAPGATGYTGVGFVEGAGTTASPQRYQYRLSGLEPGTHQFRLQQQDTDGATTLSDPVTLEVKAERALALQAAGPNPVRQETQLAFTVKQSGHAEVALYNVLGQQVRQLYGETATVGERYTVDVNATGLPTGKYFARLSGPTGTRTQQLVIMR